MTHPSSAPPKKTFPPAITLRPLGASDLKVSPIGLGCWQFGTHLGFMSGLWPKLPRAVVQDIVETSVAGGVNFFDTAESYGHGISEESLAGALRQAGVEPERAVVATKWWPLLRRARSIRRTIDQRITHLGGYPVSLYQIHHPFSMSGLRAQLEQMAWLVRRGKVQYIGVCNFSATLMCRAHEILKELGLPLVSNQVAYSLLHRGIEFDGTLEAARERRITIISHSPLAQGLLSGKFHLNASLSQSRPGLRRASLLTKHRLIKQSVPLIQTLHNIADRINASPSQVALSWLIHFSGPNVVAIPGASSVRQARENAAAMAIRLSGEDMQRLDQLSRRFGGKLRWSLSRSLG